jgi:hypothetical protein
MRRIPLTSFLMALMCGLNASCAGQNDDDFEMAKTKELLAVDVVDYSLKLQATKSLNFSNLKKLEFAAQEHAFKGEDVPALFSQRTVVHATTKANKKFAAYCGSPKNEIFDPRDKFVSDLGNRRHQYRDMYYPSDVIIGHQQEKKISPMLFFRDVGSHSTHPHAFSIDDNDKAHLIVSDVLISSENRLKIWWAIGNLSSGKWENAGLVHQNKEFTSSSYPKSAATADSIHAVIHVRDKKRKSHLVHYVWNTKSGYETPITILEADKVEFDVAGDRKADLLAVIYSTDTGVYLLTNERNEWQQCPLLPEKLKGRHYVEIENTGERQFRIRATGEENTQLDINISKR